MVTEHDKGREMTEKEVLVAMEGEKKAELEVLRKTVGKTSPVLGTTSMSQDPGPVGYQGQVPAYTPSTIPGLGPLPTSTATPQSSNDSELNRLRKENASLKFQIKDLKTKVLPRMDAFAEDLKSLNSKTTEHQLQIHYLSMGRDQLKVEVNALKGGELVDDNPEELDLAMDFE